MTFLVAIDPGKYKCGLILVDQDIASVLEGHVVLVEEVLELICRWEKKFYIEKIIIGNGTTSEDWKKLLFDSAPVKFIDETGSTILARYRYWELWPPSRFFSWIPKGLLLPPDNLDAIAALILMEKFLGKKLQWKGIHNFKI